MKRMIKIIVIFQLFISATLAGYSIGDTVRNFTLTDCNNNQISLYDYFWQQNGGNGYVILINFAEPW